MATVASGVYFIKAFAALTVLTLLNGSAHSGTMVQGDAKRDLTDPSVISQLWVVAQVNGTSLYTIENAQGGTFLDLLGGSNASATPVVGNSQSGTSVQQWSFMPTSANTTYTIVNSATNTVIDLYAGGTADGTAVNGWEYLGPTNTNQVWDLVPI
ncbi:ricin B-like lectin [Dichomitus squalens LYAD-421 SS1]|uniref:Ricin B-like lectin n=1 Tax=Dichomitus squalens (strain LYAD-421) TaxID=732165 RepID=R7SRN7_DICSQ|nr:ricin B-like lectin [Dichomitus squalens LYAD-421 SS1]EJF58711.1 ricin B-like lectin [Dichomitus squalens LYAD-421 SS1]